MVRNSPHCVFQPVSVQFADYCKVSSLAMTSRRTANRRRQVPKMTLVGSPGRAVSLPADAKSHVMVQPAQRFHRSIPAPALQHRPLPACSFHCLAGSGLCPKVWRAAGVFVLHAPSVPGLAKPMTQHFALTRQLASCHAVLCLPERTCSRGSSAGTNRKGFRDGRVIRRHKRRAMLATAHLQHFGVRPFKG